MLGKLLQIIAEGEVSMYPSIAHRLNISEGLLEGILDYLKHGGYISQTNNKCSGKGCAISCKTCSVSNVKAAGSGIRTWVLTDKGIKAARTDRK
ncbi:MAG: hypothetical protein K8S14_10860 [Actinomycetia bacterium]|nr:hypothetical protein [Actinomycetes bacterium]